MKIVEVKTMEDCQEHYSTFSNGSWTEHCCLNGRRCPGPDSRDCPLKDMPSADLEIHRIIKETAIQLKEKDKELARLKEMLTKEIAMKYASYEGKFLGDLTEREKEMFYTKAGEQIEKELKERG